MNITAWLHGLGLQQYEKAFRENEIDATVLPELTAEDLRDIGVNLASADTPDRKRSNQCRKRKSRKRCSCSI